MSAYVECGETAMARDRMHYVYGRTFGHVCRLDRPRREARMPSRQAQHVPVAIVGSAAPTPRTGCPVTIVNLAMGTGPYRVDATTPASLSMLVERVWVEKP